MENMTRLFLWFMFGGIGITLATSALVWWFESTRRLGRVITATLGKPADAIIYDVGGQKAAGLDFTAGDIAVLWNTGQNGLVFAFDEIEGAELIVDERVVARAQKGEPRRVMDETYAHAGRVTLRLVFNDVETPEFEINIFGEVSLNPVFPKTAAEAVRLGRKWLSHVDAVIKRMPVPTHSPYPTLKANKPSSEPKANAPIIPTTENNPKLAPSKHDLNDTLDEDLPF